MPAKPAFSSASSVPSTRRRLLDAAREELGLRGIDGATTRGIAERADCNEVTLFRHFESKRALSLYPLQIPSR